MKRYILFSVLIGAAAALSAADENVETSSKPQITFENSAVSQYVWRGFVVNDSPSFQPSVTAAYRGVSVNLWSNFSQRACNRRSWSESDITVEYGHRFGRLSLAGGVVDYHFTDLQPGAASRSFETYLGFGWAGFLNPSFRVYRDIQAGKGNFYSSSVARPFRLLHRTGATSLTVGLNQHQFQKHTTISAVESTTSIDAYSRERITMTPFVTVSTGHRTLFGTHALAGLRVTFTR